MARRRGGRRRDDLKDSAYKMPQIVIEQEPASLSPNPPKDTDGRREDSGRVGEGATGEMAGLIGVDWRSANGLQSPHRAPMALCGSCDARDGERIRSRELSRTGVARVCREVGSVAGWQSGGEWNGSQPGHGASELGQQWVIAPRARQRGSDQRQQFVPRVRPPRGAAEVEVMAEEARDLDEWEPANSDYNSDDDANTRIKKNL